MGIRVLCCALFLITFVHHSESDWLSCGLIKECLCKWSSGKKTASCITAGLTQIPHLATDIQVLDLNGNPIKELHQNAFANIELVNLQRLNLSSTKLRFLHQDAFKELRILIELDLSRNEFTELSPNTFNGNDRLRLLILNDNPLDNLVSEQFPSLQHLKKLELSRCHLNKVHPYAFVHLRALETVHLHQNLLSYLHHNTFNLPMLKTLTLSDNPWYCDCRMRDFHEWYLNSNLGNEEVFCSGPGDKHHISWLDIKSINMVCPPTVLSTPSVIRTEVGADIQFGCFVQGDPKPHVSWSLRHLEIMNNTNFNSEIVVQRYLLKYLDDFDDDFINKTIQWVNITIKNVTTELSGEWKCNAKSSAGEATAHLTIFLPKARTATARSAPEYSNFFIALGSVFAMACTGILAACVCWKIRRRNVPPSRSFTDQEKKLLDTSLAVSCDRTSVELGSSYGFEMFDRSISLDSKDNQHCLEPVQITIEGPTGSFPPPPAEFALPVPYGNIFISVQVTGRSKEYPDLLSSGATLPRRSRTCFIKSDYDNMGPRVTAAGSSTWSLPGSKLDNQGNKETPTMPLSTFSTEFTAL